MSVAVIVKKMGDLLNVRPSAITFGDARKQMASDLLKNLTKVIEDKADYGRPYWLMVHATIDMGVPGHRTIKEKIIILPEKPKIKYIGTCLFRIDPVRGDATTEYVLPLDIPALAGIAPESPRNGQVCMDSKGLPVFNRRLN